MNGELVTPPLPPPADEAFLAAVGGTTVSDEAITEAIRTYETRGFARLGKIADDRVLEALRDRTQAIMYGTVAPAGLFFQRDSENGQYDDLPYGKGYWLGPTDRYRKIEKLEKDPLFRAWIGNPVFERIARRVLGTDVHLLRAMIMSKARKGGTPLPFHQDAGRFWGVDPHPRLQLWTALDDAPIEAGCMEAVPESHLAGLATAQGGVVPRNVIDERNAEAKVEFLPAQAGEVILLHNLTWHRSGVNTTGSPRRAFSVCFIDALTHCTRTRAAPRKFERIFSA